MMIAIMAVAMTMIDFDTAFATDSPHRSIKAIFPHEKFHGIVRSLLLTNDFAPSEAAYEGKMDPCQQVTVGTCVQTVLFATPVVVILS
jgi:Ca2+/H+ antiporter